MVVCKEEGGKEKGESSRLQAFCGCVLGGIAAQSELCTNMQMEPRSISIYVLLFMIMARPRQEALEISSGG